MKILTKIFLVICLCLTVSCSGVPVVPSTVSPAYNFSFYSDHLSKGMFPEIEKVVISYKRFLTIKDCENLIEDVFDCTWCYIEKNKLYVSQEPVVKVSKLESKTNVAFVLSVEIHFLDKETSFKGLINTIIITKKFLIFLDRKLTGVEI